MAERGLRIGSFAGAAIVLDGSVAILAGYVILSTMDSGGAGALPEALVFLIAVFAAILAHEFGHAGAAAAFGIPSRRIVLTFFGGHVEFAFPPRKRWHNIAVLAAGPGANIAIALGLYFASPYFATPAPLIDAFLAQSFTINVILGVFNLLPGFPLDGGRILSSALSYGLSHARARQIAAVMGMIIAALGAVYGFLSGLWWTAGISVLLGLSALAELRLASDLLRVRTDPAQGDAGGASNT